MPRTDVYELSYKDWRAVVSANGAWLEKLEYRGQPVFFPKQELVTSNGHKKTRGGCHVCLPNFGPDLNTDQAQHGFARDVDWTLETGDQNNVKMVMRSPKGMYSGIDARLTYKLIDDGIEMRLTVKNTGNSEFKIAPGFHPYFSNASETISVNGHEHNTANLNEPVKLRTANNAELILGGEEYILISEGLDSWVLWTDKLGDYVCLEPTHSNFSFAELEAPKAVTMFPQQTAEYALIIQRRGQ